MRDKLVGYGMLLSLAAIWGGSFLFIKVALGSVSPVTVAAGRIGLGALVLYTVMRLKGQSLPPPGRHWIIIVIAALLGNAVPFSLISTGERHIDSAVAAMLMATIPLFTIVLAQFMTRDERLTPEKAVGVAIGFAGVVILLGPSALRGLGQQVVAQALVASAALCYATSAIFSRHLRGLAMLPTAAAILMVASAVTVPASLILEHPWTLTPTWSAIGAVAVLGVVSTALAQLLLLRILKVMTASFLSLNNYLVPLFGTLWGMLFLSERPAPTAGVALAVILLGIFVSQRRMRWKAAPAVTRRADET